MVRLKLRLAMVVVLSTFMPSHGQVMDTVHDVGLKCLTCSTVSNQSCFNMTATQHKIQQCQPNQIFCQPSHQIRPEKLLMHLVKCRKQHPNKKFAMQYSGGECPYNLHKPEIRPCVDEGQNEWDLDVGPIKSYDPTQAAMNRNVIRSIKVACKSEKKLFYELERQRLQDLANKDRDEGPYIPGLPPQEGARKKGFKAVSAKGTKGHAAALDVVSEAPSYLEDERTVITESSVTRGLGRGKGGARAAWFQDKSSLTSKTSTRAMGRGSALPWLQKNLREKPGRPECFEDLTTPMANLTVE
eukprot:maker-scaffold22_size673200-snap-gene-3.23 protein:Tk12677 transcript:maker-scaffold22_size673200-snap-gene-3.23-mRNA-1 annotation:"gametocyte-specific factor 1-like"